MSSSKVSNIRGPDPAARPLARVAPVRHAGPSRRGQVRHPAPAVGDAAPDEAAAPAPVRPGPLRDLDRGAARLRQDEPPRPVGDGELRAGRVADGRRQRQRPGRAPHRPRGGDRPRRAARHGDLRRDRVGRGVEPGRGRSIAGRDVPTTGGASGSPSTTATGSRPGRASTSSRSWSRTCPRGRRWPSRDANGCASRSSAGEPRVRCSSSVPPSSRWTSARPSGWGASSGCGCRPDTTHRLTRQTEGWPALLALATLGARTSEGGPGRSTPAPIASSTTTCGPRSSRAAPRPRSQFLTRTSILERLSAPLCDAVVEGRGSTSCPAAACTVDPAGRRLRRCVSLPHAPAGLPPARARGPRARDGAHPPSASRRLVPGEPRLSSPPSITRSRRAISTSPPRSSATAWHLFHWSGRRATIRAWASRFGADALEARPWLAVLAAWEELAAGDVAGTVRFADIAERGTFEGRPPDGTASFEAGRAMLRAAMVRQGADDALANATRAVELEGDARLVAGLRALAAGHRAPHDGRPGWRRRGLCRGDRGCPIGRPRRNPLLPPRAPRSRGRRTRRLGCRRCPHRGERRDRARTPGRRVPLEHPVSRRPHQPGDPPRGHRGGASRARSRDEPATTHDRRRPRRGRRVPPRVRPRPPRGRRPGRCARPRRAGEGRDPRSPRPRRPACRGGRALGDLGPSSCPGAAGVPRASRSRSSAFSRSCPTTSPSRRSGSDSASRRRRSSHRRSRSTASWARRPAATPSTWPSSAGLLERFLPVAAPLPSREAAVRRETTSRQ